MDDQAGPRLSRRNFLRTLLIGGVGVAALNAIVAALYFIWPNRERLPVFGSKVNVSAELIPSIGAAPYTFPEGQFHLIHNEDGLLAFYWGCTHLYCTVPWDSEIEEFNCNCHGARFDRVGSVTVGPGPRPLDLMPIEVESDLSVTVNTGRIIERERYDPSQATRLEQG